MLGFRHSGFGVESVEDVTILRVGGDVELRGVDVEVRRERLYWRSGASADDRAGCCVAAPRSSGIAALGLALVRNWRHGEWRSCQVLRKCASISGRSRLGSRTDRASGESTLFAAQASCFEMGLQRARSFDPQW